MSDIVMVLLILVVVKFIIIAVLLGVVFRKDVERYWRERKAPTQPTCMYCGSKWTRPLDEGQTRWEDSQLVLVTGYQCLHCQLPFWHVERVPVGALKH